MRSGRPARWLRQACILVQNQAYRRRSPSRVAQRLNACTIPGLCRQATLTARNNTFVCVEERGSCQHESCGAPPTGKQAFLHEKTPAAHVFPEPCSPSAHVEVEWLHLPLALADAHLFQAQLFQAENQQEIEMF